MPLLMSMAWSLATGGTRFPLSDNRQEIIFGEGNKETRRGLVDWYFIDQLRQTIFRASTRLQFPFICSSHLVLINNETVCTLHQRVWKMSINNVNDTVFSQQGDLRTCET